MSRSKTKNEPNRKRGRPSKFTLKVAQEIAARLSRGEPLAIICRDEHMPHPSTVRDWQNTDEEFSRAIARAREDGFDAIAAECLDIADDTSRDTKFVKRGEDDAAVCDAEWISRSKLRVETRLKLLAKWDPKRYGDKVQTEHSGQVGINGDSAFAEFANALEISRRAKAGGVSE